MSLDAMRISNNSLTAMKIMGIAAMLVDHFNTFVNPEYNRVLFEIGRIAFPLFALVLGYNLARVPADKMLRIMLRLLIFGALATPIYNVLGEGLLHWWPLNILFTLCLATTIIFLLSLPSDNRWTVPARMAAILLFAAAGCLVDYLWIGPALVIAVWRLFSGRYETDHIVLYAVLIGVLMGLLCLMNDSLATLLAVPFVFLSITYRNIRLPRMKWFFYWFYPGHLAALLWIKTFSF